MGNPRIGVSACLLGKNVRYDGRNKRDAFIVETLSQQFDLIPVCPETEMGLGAPRESMRLKGDPQQPRLITKSTRIDLTDRMLIWCAERVRMLEAENLQGFILKSKSPSCSPGMGLFARALARHFPDLPLIDEVQLQDAALRSRFLERVWNGVVTG